MAVTQYIGARYVPIFADPIEWSSTKSYEPLTIVTHQGASYTSRQAVPVGIDISNADFWVLTGNYNAQVEQYRQEVRTFDARITTAQDTADNAVEDIATTNENLATTNENLVATNESLAATDAKIGTIPEGYDNIIEYADERLATLGATVDDLSDTLDGFTPEAPVKEYVDTLVDGLLTTKEPIDIQTGYIETISGSDLYSYYILAKIPRVYKVSQAIRNGSVSDYSGRTYDYVKRSTDAILANGALYGPIVSKGQVKMNAGTTDHHSSYSHILCFNANNEPTVVADVDQLAQASTLLSQGYVETIPCFCPIMTNGVPQAFVGTEELLDKHTREIFAWDSDYWYVLIIEGRNPRSIGATYAEMQLICAYFGLNDAVQMDGGGSTELWVPATLQNLVFADSERVPAGYSSRYINLLTFNQE